MSGKDVIDIERLIAMANQIGDFFSPYPSTQKIEGIRNHLRHYWDPRMRQALLAYIDESGAAIQPAVIQGANLLREDAEHRKAYAGPPKRDPVALSAKGE